MNMTIIRAVGILFIVALSAGAIDLSWYVDCGGNVSYIYPTLPTNITLREKSHETFVAGGAGLQLRLVDYFRVKTGLSYERRSCKFNGQGRFMVLGFIPVDLDGSFSFTYDFVQLPIHLVGVMPMLFPGNIYLAAGPEFGIPLTSTLRETIDSSGTTKYDTTSDIRGLTRPFDFGLSGEIGYELPMGKYFSAAAFFGYYWSLLDMYKADTAANPNAIELDIYTRSIRFGVRLDFNLFTLRT